jgi:ATP-dependent Clp protease protease subunit
LLTQRISYAPKALGKSSATVKASNPYHQPVYHQDRITTDNGIISKPLVAMDSPIKAVQAPYYGDNFYRTPPPDLPSLLLKERIVYLGLPLVSSDDFKRQLGVDVTKLIIAQLLYLQFDDPEKPIFFYINSTGTSWYTGDAIGYETEAFAICDTINYIKPPVHTICIGQAMGTAAMILSSGTKGYRASLPHATIVLNQSRSGAQGQATDIQIRAKEVLANKAAMLDILSKNTGKPAERIGKDTDRMFYLNPQQAKEYGLIDRVLESTKDLPKAIPALM